MSESFNIYCDESCHLESDLLRVMVLGAVWCPVDKTREVAIRLREIKARHHFAPGFELKWSKVSPGKEAYYRDVLDYFFDDDDLCFRTVIIPDKSKLNHDVFGQDHDTWYYKMYFVLLRMLIAPQTQYQIYLDIKDTRSAQKVRKLRDVLENSTYEFNRKSISVQNVRSHEVEQLQLTDLLIGLTGYKNRGLHQNAAKVALVQRAHQRSGYDLKRNTLPRERKFNVFHWTPQEMLGD